MVGKQIRVDGSSSPQDAKPWKLCVDSCHYRLKTYKWLRPLRVVRIEPEGTWSFRMFNGCTWLHVSNLRANHFQHSKRTPLVHRGLKLQAQPVPRSPVRMLHLGLKTSSRIETSRSQIAEQFSSKLQAAEGNISCTSPPGAVSRGL